MDYVYVGKIVNTHGIKGEVRLISNFERKDLVFKKGFFIYVNDVKLEINSYRVHKNFDMLTFVGINDINDVIKYKGFSVYILRSSLNNVTLKSDLISFDVYMNDRKIGNVVDFFNNTKYDLIVISNGVKEFLIPYLDNFILNVDYDLKKISIVNMEGLVDED